MRIGTGQSCEMKWPLSWQQQQQKNGAVECVPVREDKSSIKLDLLPQKDNKLKWHSTQILINRLLTIFIHTAFIKCLRLVQSIYSKWLTHHFRHFSNSTSGVLASLFGLPLLFGCMGISFVGTAYESKFVSCPVHVYMVEHYLDFSLQIQPGYMSLENLIYCFLHFLGGSVGQIVCKDYKVLQGCNVSCSLACTFFFPVLLCL